MTAEALVTTSRWAGFDPLEVQALYDDYAALVDEGDFEAWLELFTAEATYLAIARENVDRGLPLATIRCDSRAMLLDRINAIGSTQFFADRYIRHFVTAIRPAAGDSGDADALATTANFLVIETVVDDPSRVYAAGTYRDRIVRTPEGLRFAAKQAVYDAAIVLNSLIVPL